MRRRIWMRRLAGSLRARLTLTVLSIAVAAVSAVAWLSYVQAVSALRASSVNRLNDVADLNIAFLQSWLRTQTGVVQFASTSPGIGAAVLDLASDRADTRTKSRMAIDARIRQLVSGPLPAQEVQLLTIPGGRVAYSTITASEGRFAVEDEYYVKGRDALHVQNVYLSPLTQRPTLTISAPVRDPQGRPVAVLAVHLDLARLQTILHGRTGGGAAVAVYAVNKLAQYISSDEQASPAFRRGFHSVGIDSALTGHDGNGEYRDYAGVPVLGVWRWMKDYEMALMVESPATEAFAPARALLRNALFSGIAALALLVFGLSAVARRFTAPIVAMTEAAERLARGEFDARAPTGAKDEPGRLARSFNTMAAELSRAYAKLREQMETTDQALRENEASRALLQDILDNANTIVCVVNLAGDMLIANERYVRTFTVVDGDGAHTRISAIRDSAPALLRAIEDSRRLGTPIEREISIGRAQAGHGWLASCFPLRGRDGQIYATGVIATDLTERARLEEERRHQDASVQHAQKLESLGVMAGGIAHDFNNILGAVLGNADLAMASLGDETEVRFALEQITAAARRAADLTRQMLAYAGKASLKQETIDLNGVVTDIVGLVRVAHSKKIHFEVLKSAHPAWVLADAAQLSQVVLNLVTNAAEAIRDDAGTVTIAVHDTAAPPHGAAAASLSRGWRHIVVSDTGHGMDDETRRRIFDPFFSTKASGRGLGLSAVTGIVRAAGGVLDVHSRPGEGTTFDIYLPAADAPTRPSETTVAPKTVARRGTVLVVDDEAMLRRVCTRALGMAGYEVIEAADGYAAVGTFSDERHPIDAIVLDLMMPGMSGAEVLVAIRQWNDRIPVVLCSGYDAADTVAAMPPDERVRFLQKPFSVEALTSLVGELIASR